MELEISGDAHMEFRIDGVESINTNYLTVNGVCVMEFKIESPPTSAAAHVRVMTRHGPGYQCESPVGVATIAQQSTRERVNVCR